LTENANDSIDEGNVSPLKLIQWEDEKKASYFPIQNLNNAIFLISQRSGNKTPTAIFRNKKRKINPIISPLIEIISPVISPKVIQYLIITRGI